LEEECLTGVPDKNGSYRASHCIKLAAYGYGYTYFVRTCSIDLLSGREDQEIVRVNHCGYIALKNFFGFDKLFNKNQTIYSNYSNIQPKISQNERSTFYNAAKFRGCLSVCASNECNRSSNSLFYLIDYKNNLKIVSYFSFLLFVFLIK
jgi:hypothetical protein